MEIATKSKRPINKHNPKHRLYYHIYLSSAKASWVNCRPWPFGWKVKPTCLIFWIIEPHQETQITAQAHMYPHTHTHTGNYCYKVKKPSKNKAETQIHESYMSITTSGKQTFKDKHTGNYGCKVKKTDLWIIYVHIYLRKTPIQKTQIHKRVSSHIKWKLLVESKRPINKHNPKHIFYISTSENLSERLRSAYSEATSWGLLTISLSSAIETATPLLHLRLGWGIDVAKKGLSFRVGFLKKGDESIEYKDPVVLGTAQRRDAI